MSFVEWKRTREAFLFSSEKSYRLALLKEFESMGHRNIEDPRKNIEEQRSFGVFGSFKGKCTFCVLGGWVLIYVLYQSTKLK